MKLNQEEKQMFHKLEGRIKKNLHSGIFDVDFDEIPSLRVAKAIVSKYQKLFYDEVAFGYEKDKSYFRGGEYSKFGAYLPEKKELGGFLRKAVYG